MANHDRRLERLERVLEPQGRDIFIWDDHKPGCVEREKARLLVSPRDRIISIGWERAA